MKFVSVPEMIAVEKAADRSGLTYEKMMENAGLGLARLVDERYQQLKPGPIAGLVGSGNNGGDTLVALAHLSSWGWQTQAYLARPRDPDDNLMTRLISIGGEILDGGKDEHYERLESLINGSMVLIDGILGTGIKLPLRGKVADLLRTARMLILEMDEPPAIVAVDCPSGVDCDSGEAAEESLTADLTVTMAAVKMGLLKFPAYRYVGELQLVGIGLPDDLDVWRSVQRFVVDEVYLQQHLPKRRLDAHKGTFGTALVIAGSVNYTGAAILAGESAYRVGAGLVTLGVPEPLHPILAGHLLEATWLPLPHDGGVISDSAFEVVRHNLERPTAILLGPGFGLADTTRRFLSHFLSREYASSESTPLHGEDHIHDSPAMTRLVVDADGLKLLAAIPDWHARLPDNAVLTPHPGEMSVLTGLPVSDIQADRLGIAEQYAQRWGHIVVLKGAFTVVAAPDGRTAVIPVATPALARAGTGDVLAGLVVGLLAQGVDAFSAAVTGAYIHARAGQHAAAVLGSTTTVLASDVLQGVVDILAGANID